MATYIHYQCDLPHPLRGNDYLTYEFGQPLIRSSSNPDLEVSRINSRNLDRTSSMRNTVNEHMNSNLNYQRITHQQIALHWVVSNGTTKDLSIENAWFLFELITRSMVDHLVHIKSLDASRRNRFPEEFLDDISTLMKTITSEIVSHSMSDQHKSHKLNAALAFFLFDLFSIADRGFVMQLLRTYMKQMQAKIGIVQDPANLVELKLEFIRIVCSHEHYIALNLPFATPFMMAGGSVSPSPSITSSTSQNSFLSGAPASQERVSTFAELSIEYRQHHYLTGLVLSDLATVLLDLP